MSDKPSPWVPMTNLRDLKTLGKLLEEVSELGSAGARCLIQGINSTEPTTGKPNCEWLEDEIADVIANVGLVIERFALDNQRILKRSQTKRAYLREWHEQLDGTL